jgi:hypothetical protein
MVATPRLYTGEHPQFNASKQLGKYCSISNFTSRLYAALTTCIRFDVKTASREFMKAFDHILIKASIVKNKPIEPTTK